MSSKKIPILYLDSCIILDILRSRQIASIRLMERIQFGEFKAYTSGLTILETIDKEQEDFFESKMRRDGYSFDEILRKRHERSLNEIELLEAFDKVERIFMSVKKIEFYNLESKGWDKAIELMQTLNLRSNDAVHLATALEKDCGILISNDDNFLENAEKVMSVAKPHELDKKLKELSPD